MIRSGFAVAVLVALVARGLAADDKYTLKQADTPPPKELAEPIRALLDAQALNVLDPKGKVVCTVWPRKGLESKATADQVEKGLAYTNLDETTVLGAVQFPENWGDFRKQRIKPGVYTLRLGIQPMDGDHMGTAPFNEFCLLSPAEVDKAPGLMEAKELQEMSTKATTRKHPGVMLLFPNPQPAEKPVVESKPGEIWALSYQRPVKVAGKTAALGFSLVVVGHSMAE